MENGWRECLKRLTGWQGSETSVAGHPSKIKSRGGSTRVLQKAHTVRLRPEPEAISPPRQPSRRFMRWFGVTDTGMVRDHNEDNFSLMALGDKALFVVADGMGGHDAGEIASKIAMETVCRVVRDESGRDGGLTALVERAVRVANDDVRREAARRGSDMGTTLSVALVADDTAHIASVGDSRVYWMENGSLSQVTTDHSLVAKLVTAGKLTKEEARSHPRSNLLYRTIGNEEKVKIDTFQVSVKLGGTLLLCTDGLWGEVDDDMLQQVCAGEKDVETAGARLVRLANENGGKDNITAVIVNIETAAETNEHGIVPGKEIRS